MNQSRPFMLRLDKGRQNISRLFRWRPG